MEPQDTWELHILTCHLDDWKSLIFFFFRRTRFTSNDERINTSLGSIYSLVKAFAFQFLVVEILILPIVNDCLPPELFHF